MRLRLSAGQIIGTAISVTVPVAHALLPRTQTAESYDFVVVGGGLAGLVIGGRLAEDTNHTVLVLEAGGNGDDYRERIGAFRDRQLLQASFALLTTKTDTPAYAYFDSLWGTPLDWGFSTVPQSNMNNREIYWSRGKVLGGESLASI